MAPMLKPYIGIFAAVGDLCSQQGVPGTDPLAQAPRHVGKLALFGGFADAAGGGGWGPGDINAGGPE